MDNALLRVPALERDRDQKFYNGPESFTPDNQFILGEAPEVRSFFVARRLQLGRHRHGGRGRSGAGRVDRRRRADEDLTSVDIRRFAPFNGNNRWLHDRVGEVLGLHYEVPWPNREMTTARPFRRSPVHHLLAAANANFGSRMGWERANFFAPRARTRPSSTRGASRTGCRGRRPSRRAPATAVDGVRPDVVLEVPAGRPGRRGGAAVAVHRRHRRDVGPDGVHRDAQRPRHLRVGRHRDPRRPHDEYLIVSSAATTERDKDHIRRNLPADAHAELVDVTSSYAVFGVMGPRSRELLTALPTPTSATMPSRSAPAANSLGYSTVRATRITYVGELGWELYVPAEFAVGVYEDLMAAGDRFAVGRGGYYAIESLRLEKGYRAFGRELTPDDNPVEAGLLFACKLKTDVDFLGRAAVEKAKAAGRDARLVGFAVGSADPMLWGGELVLRDGVVAGQVTSAAWGETTGSCVGLAYLRSSDGAPVTADWIGDGDYQVNVGGTLYPITTSLKAIYDPDNIRIR